MLAPVAYTLFRKILQKARNLKEYFDDNYENIKQALSVL